MSGQRLQEFDKGLNVTRRETRFDEDPCPQEISAQLALIRSRWTGQEGLNRIRRARCFYDWLLALSHQGLAEK